MNLIPNIASQMTIAFNLYDVLKNKDFLTAEHSLNVACLMKIFAGDYIALDIGEEKAFIAGLIHDVGKIKLPDFVFQNHIISSQKEKEIIKLHPGYTKTILDNTYIDRDISLACLQHHERVNGSGYPSGLKGNDIVQAARLLSIIDSFSAIMEHRPYRDGQPIKKAIEILLEEKELFDVSMLTAFIKNIKHVLHGEGLEKRFCLHVY